MNCDTPNCRNEAKYEITIRLLQDKTDLLHISLCMMCALKVASANKK